MISGDTVRGLLAPFDVSICDESIEKLAQYVDLLLRWNRKINLTSISTGEECITRHFGESFFLSRVVKLDGALLDVGSGAGFPGLALKLIAPSLEVVLLEPVGKKRAFLKEVARACDLDEVQVVGSRLDEFARSELDRNFDIITVRAVGGLESLLPQASRLLSRVGQVCLWVGEQQIRGIQEMDSGLLWKDPVAIPLSNNRKIMLGRLAGAGSP